MKRIFLLLILIAIIGSVTYAVVLTKEKKTEKKEQLKKKGIQKRSSCGAYRS